MFVSASCFTSRYVRVQRTVFCILCIKSVSFYSSYVRKSYLLLSHPREYVFL